MRPPNKRDAMDAGMAVFAMIAFFFVIAAFTHKARAADHDAGHAEHHDVYQTWRTPGSGVSCCNEKKDGTGDCYPTTALLAPAGAANPDAKGDVWWALLDDDRWIEIPDSRIVHEINPDESGSRAHVCIMDGSTVPLCFVPPFGGG